MEFYLERLDKKNEASVKLESGANAIGRHPGNNIVLSAEDRCVSGFHAVIYVMSDKLLLQDMQSTNGTYVNGTKIESERDVKNGDEIGFGASGPRYRVVCPEADGAPMPAAPIAASPAEEPEAEEKPYEADRFDDELSMPTVTVKTHAPYKTIFFVIVGIIVAGTIAWVVWVTSDGDKPQPAAKRQAGDFFSMQGKTQAVSDDDGDVIGGGFDGIGAAAEPRSVEAKLDIILRRFGERDYQVPVEMIDRVEHYLKQYTGPMKRTVARYMERRKIYFPMIRRVFTEKNIPLDLAYVSILESGLDPNALSHAGAKGLWQFMPKTARDYGLEVSDRRDERTDPEKATYAAAAYFRHLIAIFGSKSSVMLCMAAYNAGEGRVIGALKRIEDPVKNRDFWYIYKKKWLAEETNEYIPQVLALIIISENMAEYGFE